MTAVKDGDPPEKATLAPVSLTADALFCGTSTECTVSAALSFLCRSLPCVSRAYVGDVRVLAGRQSCTPGARI